MSQVAETTLKDIIGRHGVALLDDQRRCEACLRDTQLARRDIIGLVAALKSGLPARILQHRGSGLTAVAISNYAARLSEETGLDQDLARGALQSWAYALDVKVSGPPGIGKRHEEPGPDPVPPPPPPGARDIPWLPLLFAIQGFLLVAGQGDRELPLILATYAAGSLSVLVGAMLLRAAKWIRWPAVALCALIVVLAFVGRDPLHQTLEPEIIAAGVFSLAGAAGLLLWKSAARPIVDRWDRKHTIAAVVLCVALWDICKFAAVQGGLPSALISGYAVHPKFVWHWLNVPLDLALVWLAWSVLTRPGARLIPPILGASLLGAGVILNAISIVVAQGYGGLSYVPWLVPEAMAIVASSVATIFLIVGREPTAKGRPRESPRG